MVSKPTHCSVFRKVTYETYEGVPGCGKTTLLKRLSGRDGEILVTTRAMKDELTRDGYRAHIIFWLPIVKGTTLLVDEYIMIHPGVVDAVLYLNP